MGLAERIVCPCVVIVVLLASTRWRLLGLVACGGLLLATAAQADRDDPFGPFYLDSAFPAPTLAPVPPTPLFAAERDALTTVAYFNQVWSEDSLAALPEIRFIYAAEVEFYGSTVSVDDIMADKVALAERWAEREYSLDRAASTATCVSIRSCLVDGEVVWASSTPDGARRSGGRARVLIGLERIDGRFRIVREEGDVIERE